MNNNQKQVFRNFDDAKSFAISLNLKNKQDWQNFASSNKRPKDIPFHPATIYKNKGWKNYGDWLGHYPKLSRSREYLSFEEAKIIVKTLSIKTLKEWQRLDSDKRIELKLPASPTSVYKEKWISWTDWLGNNNISNRVKEYLSFEEAKKLVHTLNLRGQNEYTKYVKDFGYKQKLPHTPERYYKNKGWISTADFLGYKSNKRESFEQKYLYFYDLGNDIIGYGITYELNKRNIEHKMEAKKVGCKINRLIFFKFKDGRDAINIESYFKKKYKKESIKIKGFKTENTSVSNYQEMIDYILLKQKTDNN